MERREKTEFLLEQMRLLVTVARAKDREGRDLKKKGTTDKVAGGGVASLDGDTEWAKVRVGGRRIPEAFLAEEKNQVGLPSR
jgi:26S proteasome regulatory subunit N5